MKNVYLDVDGVLVLDDLENAGKGALRLGLFLLHIGNLQADGVLKIHWLTTHCRNGSDENVLKYLKTRLDPHDHDLIIRMKIEPTSWKELKTEAIDFSKDFLWIDDELFPEELDVLKKNNAENKFVKIDLQKNKYQLKDITYSGVLNED